MQDNYGKIVSVHALIHQQYEDLTVEVETVKTVELANGGTATFGSRPLSTWRHELFLEGQKIRRDTTTADSKTAETLLFLDGYWTVYNKTPAGALAMIKLPQDMAANFPPDPRELPAADLREPLADILRSNRVIEARHDLPENGREMIEIVTSDTSGTQTVYEFSADVNFLPTRAYTREMKDGSVLHVRDIVYQDVLDGDAKFLQSTQIRFFPRGVAKSPDDPVSPVAVDTMTVEDVQVNERLRPEAFALVFDEGTRVVDSRIHKIYHAAAPPLPATTSIIRIIMVVITVVAIVVLMVAILLQRVARRRVS